MLYWICCKNLTDRDPIECADFTFLVFVDIQLYIISTYRLCEIYNAGNEKSNQTSLSYLGNKNF